MQHHSPTINLRLDLLEAHPDPLRKTRGSPRHRARVKATVRTFGLLHPLLVHPTPRTDPPRYRVVAGAVRLEAMRELADEGTKGWDASTLVPCRVASHDARTLALAENLAREPLSVVDTHDALEALYRAGETPDTVRRDFGIEERELACYRLVERLHPQVREAARRREMCDRRVRAYARCEDREEQLRHWNVHRDAVPVSKVREALAGDTLACDHPWVREVGADEYERTGGRFVDDLFSRGGDEALRENRLVRDAEHLRRMAEGGPDERVPAPPAASTRGGPSHESESPPDERAPALPAVFTRQGRRLAFEAIAERVRRCEEEELQAFLAEELQRIAEGRPSVLRRTARARTTLEGLDPDDAIREATVQALNLDDDEGFARAAHALRYDPSVPKLCEDDLAHVPRGALANWVRHWTGDGQCASWIRTQDARTARTAVACAHQRDVENLMTTGIPPTLAHELTRGLRRATVPGCLP